jgi:hypothetical protein
MHLPAQADVVQHVVHQVVEDAILLEQHTEASSSISGQLAPAQPSEVIKQQGSQLLSAPRWKPPFSDADAF